MSEELSTRDKILNAAIDLFSQNGFKGVTTKQIAEAASVNEVTLFRQFGSKKKIFEEVMEVFHFETELKTAFKKGIVWDLEQDLVYISKIYYEYMKKNKKLILTGVKESIGPNNAEYPHEKFPKKIKGLLIEYFEEMQNREKMIQENPEVQAIIFLFTNFGSAINYELLEVKITEVSLEEFIKNSVNIFVKAWRI